MEVLSDRSLDVAALSAERILLLNAPAVDVRLPWARWQQPVGLLRIGAALRKCGCDVRLIDCLQAPADGRLSRELADRLQIEGETLNLWRFGLRPAKVVARLRSWEQDGWRPERVLVSCGLSTWWLGTRDLIGAVKQATSARVILGGPYPTFYPGHAVEHTAADTVVVGGPPEAGRVPADLSLYEPASRPRFAGLYLVDPAAAPAPRAPEEVAEEVRAKVALGVTTFAFFDDWLGPEHREALAAALEAVARVDLEKAGFVAIGNFSPRLVDGELASLLRRVRFRQVRLHDDVAPTPTGLQHLSSEEDYAACVRALHRAGFRPRMDEIGAGVLVGLPGEHLAQVTERLVRLASIVGSVNLVPYQFTPGTRLGSPFEEWVARRNGHLDPATLNAQLYPLARLAGASLEDYRELTRLAALLNAKYRSRTFDFLGNSLTARMVRASLREKLWDPFRSPPPQGNLVPLAQQGEDK